MPKRIDVGAEIIEFPDEMDDSQIQEVLRKQFPTPKKQPTAASRFLENTVKPIEAVSDSVQSAMRSQNPIGELVSSAGGAAKDFLARAAATRSGKAGNPIGAIGEVLLEPVATVGRDLLEGNPGAAIGGAAGLALPFLPKGVKAAAGIDRAAIAAGAKGAAKAGARQIPELLTNTDVTRPLKAIPDVFNAIRETVRGGRAGLDALAAKRRIKPGRAVEPVIGESPVDATPIPGDLPSGRRPMTVKERELKYGKPLPQPTPGNAPSVRTEPVGGAARLSTEKMADARGLAEAFPDLVVPGPEYPARNYLAGKAAEKAINIADFLDEHQYSSELIADATPEVRKAITEQLNRVRKTELGDKYKAHDPPSDSTWAQVVERLREIEARKATEQ